MRATIMYGAGDVRVEQVPDARLIWPPATTPPARPGSARVGSGRIAAVVGDGAVGLCGVIAAKHLGAEQVILLGRHLARIALAKAFGATDIVSERGDEAIARVLELTGGLEQVPTGYRAMNDREAIKAMISF